MSIILINRPLYAKGMYIYNILHINNVYLRLLYAEDVYKFIFII